jgi:galactokinase
LLGCSDTELVAHSLNASTAGWMRDFWLAKRAEHVFNEAARVLEFQRVCDQQRGGYLGQSGALLELARNFLTFF